MNNFRTQFTNALAAVQKEFPHRDYGRCYTLAAERHKDLFLAMLVESAEREWHRLAGQGLAPRLQFANEEFDPAESSLSKTAQQEMFGLDGCDDEEMQVAFKGNNNKWRPVNYPDIFAALVTLFRTRAKNLTTHESGSILDAVHQLRGRFPKLYSLVNGGTMRPAAPAPTPEIANTKPEGTQFNVVPPQLASLWRISGCTALEYAAVSEGLGGPASAFDKNRVVKALVAFYQREGLNYTAAWNKALQKFPQLAACFQTPAIDYPSVQ